MFSYQLVNFFRCRYYRLRLRKLGRGTLFFKNTVIHSPGNVQIGCYSRIGDFVVIWGAGGVTIGDNVLIAAHSVISSQTHDAEAVLFRTSLVCKQVIIADNVWIGASAVILPGVTVGTNSIIGAGAVVTRDVPADSVAVGIPAAYRSRSVG